MNELRDLARDVRSHPWVPDVVMVAALSMWVLFTAAFGGFGELVLGLLQIVPLFWRRREPLKAAAGVAAACLLQVAFTDSPHPANVAVPIAVYSAAAFGTRRQSFTVLGLGLVGALIAGADWRWRYEPITQQLVAIGFQTFFMSMFVLVAWVLGDVVRRRRAVVARLEQQNAALARDQAQRARLTAQSERAAIAREMHDVVAHSLAVVVVQADGALYAARQALAQPPSEGGDRAALERAVQTFETLADTARTSLADTRRLVGVLRDEGSGAELAPLQGLAHLDDLVQRVRDSGVPVHLAVRGPVDDLPKEIDLAAYRVVQEALTNVMKHAGPQASVDVDLLRTPAVLLVRVTDDGGGSPHPPAPRGDGLGNGLLGMTERVEVLDGTVHAGPRARGGWEVVATIPVGPRDGIPSTRPEWKEDA
ncbi:sensor histidine kinase [Ornithinimicrobium humiphilum]|uniref:histidine kinase n=1 Tax=Ornithinimicrobium humiphilum TaxID=125288 RepID=A0A543K6G6_9MICO|nr:histidine kinase [Ornithinimicrobium humiphilum]TQM90673.1 signal transduction histidine kinase [Ornithinimicrobium humiphilum]